MSYHDPTANAHTLRAELAELRSQLARMERWRRGLRSAISAARSSVSLGGDLSRALDMLHDACDEGVPDLTMRTTLGGDRPGSEREDYAPLDIPTERVEIQGHGC